MIKTHLFALFIITACCSATAFAERPSQPNIIFILADDLGIGDLKCYNEASRIPTPHLDRLAKTGMRFTDAHAPASICVPSRYGLLTGRYPFRKWWGEYEKTVQKANREWVHFGPSNLKGEEGTTTIASLLRSKDYSTACFGKWHLGMQHPADKSTTVTGTPIQFGFDYYFGIDAPEIPPYAFIENERYVTSPSAKIREQMGNNVSNPKTQGAHWYGGEAAPDWKFIDCLPTINQKAIDYIQRHAEKETPYFVYLSYPSPHAPWLPTKAFQGKSGAGQYGDWVMTLDDCVGKILETLDATGTADNTLVVFSSDNGPVWYKSDIERFDHRASGKCKGMKGALHEAGHRMPFLVRWPTKVDAGTTCDKLVCFTDMMATFAEIVDSEMPDNAGQDSFSILPYLLSEVPQRATRSELIHSHNGVYTLAFREGDYKLILPHWTYIIKDRTIAPEKIVDTSSNRYPEIFELYNLRDDPSEERNLFAVMPEKAQMMFDSLVENIKKGASR
jgi:arylsulfatase A